MEGGPRKWYGIVLSVEDIRHKYQLGKHLRLGRTETNYREMQRGRALYNAYPHALSNLNEAIVSF
jgi:hypothetical protein